MSEVWHAQVNAVQLETFRSHIISQSNYEGRDFNKLVSII